METVVTGPFDKKPQHTFAGGEYKLTQNTTKPAKRKKNPFNFYHFIKGTQIAYRSQEKLENGETIDYLLFGVVEREPVLLGPGAYLIAIKPDFTKPITKVAVAKNSGSMTSHRVSTIINSEEYKKDSLTFSKSGEDIIRETDVVRIIKRGPETSLLEQNVERLRMPAARGFRRFYHKVSFTYDPFTLTYCDCFKYIGLKNSLRIGDLSAVKFISLMKEFIPLSGSCFSKAQMKKFKKLILKRKNHFLGISKKPALDNGDVVPNPVSAVR